MSRDISLYIKDILQNMRDAQEFIQGFSYDQFASDKKTLNAVVRSIEVIGEAAKKVPDEIRAKYPSNNTTLREKSVKIQQPAKLFSSHG